MNTKKLIEFFSNVQVILSLVVVLATVLGKFLAPHLIKYILVIALWVIFSLLLWFVGQSVKKSDEKTLLSSKKGTKQAISKEEKNQSFAFSSEKGAKQKNFVEIYFGYCFHLGHGFGRLAPQRYNFR